METPYQSRPLLQRRRRRSSAASAAALCSPFERHRVGRQPQPPGRAATTPSRPLGRRPRPPRCAHRRLRLRAADAADTDADASSSSPPSFSLKANKHHGGSRLPQPASAPTAAAAPTSGPPIGRRRRARPFGPGGGVAPRTPLPRPRPFTPALGAVSRPGALRGRRSRLSSRFARCSFAASCLSALNAAPSFTQLFFCLGLSALISRLPSVFPIFLSFVGPVNHVEIGISFQTCDLSRYLDLPKDETVHREQSHNSSCLKCAEKVNS